MRDTDGFSFYNFGLPILAVRYLAPSVDATYQQNAENILFDKGFNLSVQGLTILSSKFAAALFDVVQIFREFRIFEPSILEFRGRTP